MEEADRQKKLKAVLHYFYQDNTRSGSHCRYSLQCHLVWIPKYRRSFLLGEIAERLKQILKGIARDYRIRCWNCAQSAWRNALRRKAIWNSSFYSRPFYGPCLSSHRPGCALTPYRGYLFLPKYI